MKLNKDLIMQSNTVVWARTEEEARILCEWADGENLKHYTGNKYNLTSEYFGINKDSYVSFVQRCIYDLYEVNRWECDIYTLDDITIKEKEKEEMLVADFKDARVGDRVKCLYFGEGVVDSIVEESSPIGVLFDRFKDDENDENRICYYDTIGGYAGNERNTLFYHFEGQFPTKEACKRPLPKIELIKSTTKNCCNCTGCGEDCKNGKAWVYCDNVADLEMIDGYDETGELTGCNFFKYRMKVDEKVLVWNVITKSFQKRYFSKMRQDGSIDVFQHGHTSWISTDNVFREHYTFWKLQKDETINSGNLEEIE